MVSTASVPVTANQFFQGLICPPVSIAQSGDDDWQSLSADAQIATQRLLDIIRHLCAPNSGWPDDQPQTPENLLPYVNDEAEELLETLQHNPVTTSVMSSLSVRPELLKDLSTALLGTIAASSPMAMKLLEGVAASISTHPDSYGVRLVPALQMQLGSTQYALDLATQTHFVTPTTLPERSILSCPDCVMGERSLAQLQQAVWDGAIALAPELQEWRQGLDLPVLLPGQTWTTVAAVLVFAWVPLTTSVTVSDAANYRLGDVTFNRDEAALGMPSVRVWLADSDEDPPFIEAHTKSSDCPNIISPRVSLEADVTFTDLKAWQAAIAPLVIEQMSHRARDTPLTPLDLVTQIFGIVHSDMANHAMDMVSPYSLAELCQQIKWLWMRASPRLMPLMSGVIVRHLVPGSTWEIGTLITQGYLSIQSPDQAPVYLDVSTGAWCPNLPTLSDQDVIHWQTPTVFAQDLWTSSELAAYCMERMRQRSPLLAYLMSPVAVQLTTPQDVLFSDHPPSETTLQFHLNLTFLP
jgi:hypothetical protein